MRRLFLMITIFSLHSMCLAQTGTIKGEVRDAVTNLTLSGANITLKESYIGTTTNRQGNFLLKSVAPGIKTVVISYIGYKTTSLKLNIQAADTTEVLIDLAPTVIKTDGVIITASRYQRELDDLPIPVSMISSEDISTSAPRTVADALQSEPGISLGRDGAWGTRAVVRGLTDANLVTLIDGNRVDTSTEIAAGLSLVALDDIERVEVIRGAGSALYGTGAIGGVINIITRQGQYGEGFYISGAAETGYSAVNNLQSGSLRAAMGTQRWHARVSLAQRQADDLNTPEGVLKNSQFSDNNVAAQFALKPYGEHEIKLNYQRFKAQDVGIPGAAPLFPAQADVRYPDELREMLSIEFFGRKWTSFLRQTSLKYFIQNIDRNVENMPHIVNMLPGVNGQPAKRVSVLKVLPQAEHKTNGFQLQSDWLIDKNQYLIVGIDYWKKRYSGLRDKFQKIEIISPADGSVMSTIDKQIAERPLPDANFASAGIFGQDEIRLLKQRLVITIGGRFDRIEISNDSAFNPLYEITNGVRNDNPSNQTLLWRSHKTHDYSWSANWGALYHVMEYTDASVTIAKSFRSPYLEERYQYIDLGSMVNVGDPDLKPEKGLFADIGLRLKRNSLKFAGNIFINRLQNLVIDEPSTFEGRPALIKANVGEAQLVGFDARIDWEAHSALGVFGTVAYVRGEDLKQASPLPLIPPLNGKIGIIWALVNQVKLSLSATLFTSQNRTAAGELATPGYTILDLFLNTTPMNLGYTANRFVLGVENITNASYRNHLSTNRGTITGEPGRNFSIKWKVEF
ncbi:TonB-dependent receptor [candidate division KSB1 bacterium]|nr:TonB-dependent receptor [candidate division KSB1 bacterium]